MTQFKSIKSTSIHQTMTLGGSIFQTFEKTGGPLDLQGICG